MIDRPSFLTYYANLERLALQELARESPDYLGRVDFEEYLAHLVDKLKWQPLEWDEGGKTVEPFVGRREIRDGYRGWSGEVEVAQVRLRIPFRPHPQRGDFFRLLPSSYRLSGEPEWQFEGNTLVLETDATEQAVERALEEMRFWIGTRNRDIQNGNATLPNRVAAVWRQKRDELEKHDESLRALTAKLKIPLHQSSSAPKPIALPATRKPTPRPLVRPGTPEPELDRASVESMVNFVEVYARQLEVTPEVYSKLKEESLRDLVLSMLNVNYPGSSGETFSKRGKTDLLLRAGGGGSLIAECKRWAGPKQYGDALDQLFGYLTWRHSYGVLLSFCTRRDLTVTITSAKKVISEHPSTVGGSVRGEGSRFGSRHLHPQDAAKSVEIFHLFIDLSVEPAGA